MRAPDFWWQPEPSLLARLLSPLGSLYGAVSARRMKHQGQRSALPVLCIGNFVAGGAGKTPAAIAIARYLQVQGERPVFLSRGYRGKITTSCQVDLARHNADDAGDEALLLARVAPTIVGADRATSAQHAEALGASLIIMDDGLQNPSLKQDFRLAVVDAHTGIGNGLCIPAGPLRAPLARQLSDASALLLIGAETGGANLTGLIQSFGKPVLRAQLRADKAAAELFAGQKVVAFAGIGLPEKFRATLTRLGADVVGWRSFPDHHIYALNVLRELQSEAALKSARLVTTEKDFVRIKPLLERLNSSLPLPIALPVELRFDDTQKLDDLLTAVLRSVRSRTNQPI